MSKLIRVAILASLFGLANLATPKAGVPDQPLRLVVKLSDGSSIIGVPAMKTIAIQTAYAQFEVPLKSIRRITMEDNHESAYLELQSDERLKGAVRFGPLELQTIFGRVRVPMEHIKTMAVNDSALLILKAVYGSSTKKIDVVEQIRALARDGKLTVTASNDIAGDPHFGPVKTLHIDYLYNGEEGSVDVTEGQTVSIP
jgi:hypothetical protein